MAEEKKSFFARLREGLTKTRNNIVKGFDSVFSGYSVIDDEFYEELEETMIMGDLGGRATEEILDRLKEQVNDQGICDPQDCREILIDSIREQMHVGKTAYDFEKEQKVRCKCFSGRKQGQREICKSEKKTGKRCDLENSSAAKMAVYGYCLCCSRCSGNGSYPAADPGKNRRYSHSGKSRDILGDFPLFYNDCTYRIHGICQGRSAYRIWAENHTCT